MPWPGDDLAPYIYGEVRRGIDQIVMAVVCINRLPDHPPELWITLSKRFLTTP